MWYGHGYKVLVETKYSVGGSVAEAGKGLGNPGDDVPRHHPSSPQHCALAAHDVTLVSDRVWYYNNHMSTAALEC